MGRGLIGFVFVWVAFISCERIKPEPPPLSSIDSTLEVPLSTITIPIQYDVISLEKLINEKIKGTFIDTKFKVNDKGDSLYLQIEKNGPILVSWNRPTLYYSVPVRVSGKFVKQLGNLTVRNNTPVVTEIVLHMSTKLGLAKDWQLSVKSDLEEIKWVVDPKLKVGLIKVNLRKVVDEAVFKNKDKLTAKMDEMIPTLLQTRKVVQKLWTDLQKPIRINKKEKQVWIKVYGADMAARITDAGRDTISLQVQLKAQLETVMEGEVFPASDNKLPDYKQIENPRDSLEIFLKVRIPFSDAEEILNRELQGKEFSAEGYKTEIRQLKIYGTDSAIALQVNVKGDVDGKIYFTASPGYDTASSTLFASRFGYDVDTQNTLISSANWLLRDQVLDLVKDKLRIQVKPFMDSLPTLIMQGIEKGKVGEKIDLTIHSLDIKPINYIITKRDLQIIFLGYGHARINLEQKIFAGKKKKKKRKPVPL